MLSLSHTLFPSALECLTLKSIAPFVADAAGGVERTRDSPSDGETGFSASTFFSHFLTISTPWLDED